MRVRERELGVRTQAQAKGTGWFLRDVDRGPCALGVSQCAALRVTPATHTHVWISATVSLHFGFF